ncbi:MAG: hypothetical protein JNK02_16220 [Planctomycetes bacterium]|nr:hypothetical protein [Planctomycetota bacterium]
MRTLTALACAAACAAAAACATSAPAPGSTRLDPSKQQVVLSERAGWRADLVHDQGDVGIWTVKAFDLFPQYGTPELVSLDDRGRALIHVSYSGKWTTTTLQADGAWLGGLDLGDVDPRVTGRELYTGGKSGNVYEIVPYPDGGLDQRRIANLGRREVHTLVVADVLPRAGLELLAFTSPGGLYVLAPRTDGLDGFETLLHEELGGRVRDALLLPVIAGAAPEIATVSRAGALEILSFPGEEPRWTRVHSLAQGRGRLALAPGSTPARCVLYTTADDGTIWRHERAAGLWHDELVYAGPPGPRGLAAGRFAADPALETLVVCGYGAEVELLTRGPDGWTVETIFVDRDQGHWITTCEVDGRNGTDEIALSGYGGRVVLLSRAAGFGLGHALARPGPAERAVASPAAPQGAQR